MSKRLPWSVLAGFSFFGFFVGFGGDSTFTLRRATISMSSPCRWMSNPSYLRRSVTPMLDCERERFWQPQQLLGLQFVGGTGPQQCLQHQSCRSGIVAVIFRARRK